ncbi:MAG: hypothetical protein K6E59_00595 [Bacilli bacterium]|nr:hypothetical protein [Bacilli bacterium]
MRKQHLGWIIGVFGIVGTVYGAYLLIYHHNHGNGLSVPALILLVTGIVALIFALSLAISVYVFDKKKAKNVESVPAEKEQKAEEKVAEPVQVEKASALSAEPEPEPEPEPDAEPEEEPEQEDVEDEVSYEPIPQSSYSHSSRVSYSTAYVKLVGYGPLLRVEGPRILDMRSNTYYRIEGDVVMQEGYGIRYEIRGNQIRDAFGGYLYEYSGSNINKVFGGFYASVSGSYITLYDSSKKYEVTDSLSKKQILVVVALLFQ